jgi:protoporphyrinogen oxidase
MADVIVIGGGLSGLSAAWQLEQLGVDYTLIEVKPRLGGSIISARREGFRLDGGPFILEKYGEWNFLAELGLQDALEKVGIYRTADVVIFRNGTQTLIDRLAQKLTHPMMTRMAVSSIGRLDDGRYGVCLENGLVLEARAVVLAAPARYAERMLWTLLPAAAEYFMNYRYERIVRVSLGYRLTDLPTVPQRPQGSLFRYIEGYTFSSRVPEGHVLLRAGVRLDADPLVSSADAALAATRQLVPHAAPVCEWVTDWAEDFALTRNLPEHRQVMDLIDDALPAGLALVGSDYRARRLNEQVEQGRAAARQVAMQLA